MASPCATRSCLKVLGLLSLLPTVSSSSSAFSAPHYACTWSLQNYMALDLPQATNVTSAPFMGGAGNALAQAHINASYVNAAPSDTCRGCGWAQTLHPRARARMTLLLDAGWEGGVASCPDAAKFPPAPPGATCEAQLAALAAHAAAAGWRGFGLWFGGVDGRAGPATRPRRPRRPRRPPPRASCCSRTSSPRTAAPR